MNKTRKYLTIKQKRYVIAIVVGIMTLIYSLFFIYNQTQKQYIQGNILNLPFIKLENTNNPRFYSPFKNQSIASMFVYRSLFSYDYTLENNIQPDLADSFKIYDDGLIYTIVLNENNYWSDGVLITAEDVLFTIKAVLKDSVEYSSDSEYMYSVVLNYIKGAEDYKDNLSDEIEGITINDNIITIELTHKYNTFLPVISQLVILPYHILKDEDLNTLSENDFWLNPVVSGMYMFSEEVNVKKPNIEEHYFRLVPNEYYTGKKSSIEEVRLHLEHEDKKLDYYITSNVSEMINYGNSLDYAKYNLDMLLYTFFVFNISSDDGNYNQQMDNVKVRQAIISALDREKILSTVYLGVGEIINSGVVNHNPANNSFEHEYDPDKSIQLLEEANYDFSRPFVIAYQHEDYQTMHLLSSVLSYLEKVGLKVELLNTSTEKEMYFDKNYDMILQDYSAFNENAWYSKYDKANIYHINLFSLDNDFEGLFSQLRESKTPEERTNTLKLLQNLEQEKLYILPMYSLNKVTFINTTRVNLPDNIKLGNSSYRYDIKVEDWSINRN